MDRRTWKGEKIRGCDLFQTNSVASTTRVSITMASSSSSSAPSLFTFPFSSSSASSSSSSSVANPLTTNVAREQLSSSKGDARLTTMIEETFDHGGGASRRQVATPAPQSTYGKMTESTKRSAAEQQKDRERPYPAPSTTVERRSVGTDEWHCVQPRLKPAVYMYVHYQLKRRGFRPFYVVETDPGNDAADYQLCTEKDKVSELQQLLAQYMREFQTGKVDVFVYKIPVTANMKAVIEWTWEGGLQTDAYSIRAPAASSSSSSSATIQPNETDPATAYDAWIKSGPDFSRWYRALRKLQRDEAQQAWVDLPLDKIALQSQTSRSDLMDWCVPYLEHSRVDGQRLQVPMQHFAQSIQSVLQCGAKMRAEEQKAKWKTEDEDGFGVLEDDDTTGNVAASAEDDPLYQLTSSSTERSAQVAEESSVAALSTEESKEPDEGTASGPVPVRELPAGIQTNILQPIVKQVGLLVPTFAASQSTLLQTSVLDPLPSVSTRVMRESDLTLLLGRSVRSPRLVPMTASTSFPLDAMGTKSNLPTSANPSKVSGWTAREVLRLSPREWLRISDSEALQVSRQHSLVLRYANIHTRQPALTSLWLVWSDDAYHKLMEQRIGPIVQRLQTWLSNESTSQAATYELRQTGSVSLKVFTRLAPFVFSSGAMIGQPDWVPNEWFGLYHLLQRPILDSVDAICQAIRKDSSRTLLAQPDTLPAWLSMYAPWCSIPRLLPVLPKRSPLRYAGVLSIRRLTEGPMFSIAGDSSSLLVDEDGDQKRAMAAKAPEPFFDLVRMANGRMFLLPRAEAFEVAYPSTAKSIRQYVAVLRREGRNLGTTAPHYLARLGTARPDEVLRYDKDRHLLELDGSRLGSWHWTTWSEEEPAWFDPFEEWMAVREGGDGNTAHWMTSLTNSEEFLTLLRSVVRLILSFIRVPSDAYLQRLRTEFLSNLLPSSSVLPILETLTNLCPSSQSWCQRVQLAYVLLVSSGRDSGGGGGGGGSTPSQWSLSLGSEPQAVHSEKDLFDARRIQRACAVMDALDTLPWFLHFAANEPLPASLCEPTTPASVSSASFGSLSSLTSSASSAASQSASVPSTKGV